MIYEFPNYVDLELIQEIKNQSRQYIKLGKKDMYLTRGGDTVEISLLPELKELDNKLHNLVQKIQTELVQDTFYPQHKSADTGYQYHRYNVGDECTIHADGEMMDGLLRYASVVIHLSTNDEGGELVFPQQNKKIKTEEGKVVVFSPHGGYGHYVTPSSTPREVVVTWFCYDGVTIIGGPKTDGTY